MIAPAFLAIDWGTTNRRVYRIEAGVVTATTRDDHGVLAMAGGDWPRELAAIRAAHGELPVLIAGMAGSNRGWREVPYAALPARIDDLAARLLWVEPARTAIVPGVAQRTPGRPDVMRGEEVQLLGAVAAGLVPRDALLAQPGTHCKWVTIADGAIAAFTTAMTGELFALVQRHSILASQFGGAIGDGPAFRAGVRRAAEGDLLAALFGVRAASVLGMRDDAEAASYASGLIIGSDVAARDVADRDVHLLADTDLGALYAGALAERGGCPHIVDSHAAFVAGIVAIAEQMS